MARCKMDVRVRQCATRTWRHVRVARALAITGRIWSAGQRREHKPGPRPPRLGLLVSTTTSCCRLCLLAGHVGRVPRSQDYTSHRRLGRCLVLHRDPCHWGRECAEARSNYCVSPTPCMIMPILHSTSHVHPSLGCAVGSRVRCPESAPQLASEHGGGVDPVLGVRVAHRSRAQCHPGH